MEALWKQEGALRLNAVRCAVEVQTAMLERDGGLPPERRIEFRVSIHLGDVVEESDGDLMGDGVNIAARLEGVAETGAICLLEEAPVCSLPPQGGGSGWGSAAWQATRPDYIRL